MMNLDAILWKIDLNYVVRLNLFVGPPIVIFLGDPHIITTDLRPRCITSHNRTNLRLEKGTV
jgi:hypothetical protein